MTASAISVERVTKVYDGAVRAVDDVTLEVRPGEFVVLVGPSGCGKSTLLRMIAGLEKVTAGTVRIGERDVTTVPPPDRDIAMVFQNYALYPHKSVKENLAFGLRQRRTPKDEVERRVAAMASLLGLEGLMDRRPAQLSGGQRQRVAMGRALVREPQAFLLDEPLSNLDAKLRTTMRAELARLHERLGVTTVYVTHDQIEAMTLGQRVAVLRDGVLQQFDVPQELFRRPVNLFVAAFIGSPPMNLVGARVDGDRVAFAGPRAAAGRPRSGGRRRARHPAGRVRARRAAGRSRVAPDGGRCRGRRGAGRRGARDVPDRRVAGRGRRRQGGDRGRRGGPSAGRRPGRPVLGTAARARGRPARASGSRSRSTPASCTCSTRPTAARCAQTMRTSRASSQGPRAVEPAGARHLRVRCGGSGGESERGGPVAADVERREEAAERRVAAADRVVPVHGRRGTQQLPVGRRELEPVGAVGDRRRAVAAAGRGAQRVGVGQPELGRLARVDLHEVGAGVQAGGEAGAARVERHPGAGLAGDAHEPAVGVVRCAGRERAR